MLSHYHTPVNVKIFWVKNTFLLNFRHLRKTL